MKDIQEHTDIVLLVDQFYSKIKTNPILSPIFSDVAKVDWAHHLTKMYSFWGSILLGEQTYSGNPMQVHVALSKLTPLSKHEFDEWLLLFNATVDELFSGTNAEEAKLRAANIARLMLHKIQTQR